VLLSRKSLLKKARQVPERPDLGEYTGAGGYLYTQRVGPLVETLPISGRFSAPDEVFDHADPDDQRTGMRR